VTNFCFIFTVFTMCLNDAKFYRLTIRCRSTSDIKFSSWNCIFIHGMYYFCCVNTLLRMLWPRNTKHRIIDDAGQEDIERINVFLSHGTIRHWQQINYAFQVVSDCWCSNKPARHWRLVASDKAWFMSPANGRQIEFCVMCTDRRTTERKGDLSPLFSTPFPLFPVHFEGVVLELHSLLPFYLPPNA